MKQFLRLGGIALGVFMTAAMAAPDATVEQLPLPDGPLLKRMADFSAMQISYTYPQDQVKPGTTATTAPPPPFVPSYIPSAPARVVTLTRTKSAWHVVRVDILGNKVEQWSDGNDVFCEASGMPDPIMVMRDQLSGFPDYAKIDFPDMEWVSPETYQGVQILAGRKCLVFLNGDREAWVDVETRLAVQWQQGGETRAFKQLSPPTGMLVLPPKIAALSAVIKHDRANLMRPIITGG